MCTGNKYEGKGQWGVYGDWNTYIESLPKEQWVEAVSCDECGAGCSTCLASLVGLETEYDSEDLTAEQEMELNNEFMSRVRDYVGNGLKYRTFGEKPWDKVLMEILYRNQDAVITEQEKFNAGKEYEYWTKAAECYKKYMEQEEEQSK